MRQSISAEQFTVQPYSLWGVQRLLLTAGDFASGQFNCMTVGWGSLGRMWSLPFAQVVVRQHRYTFEFIEKFPTFTLCAFPEQYYDAITLLGTKSGRNSNKLVESGLTPQAASVVAAPVYAEAELVIECRKMYWQDMEPSQILYPEVHTRHYGKKDYHRIYFGEILAISGSERFHRG